MPADPNPNSPMDDLDKLSQEKQLPLLQEFLVFLRENKKWWLLPILLVLGLMGALAIFGSTGAAPFIYTLF